MKTHAVAPSTPSRSCPGSSFRRLSTAPGALGLVTGLLVLSPFLCSPARAAAVTNFNFDDLTLGTPIPTTFPAVDPLPQDTVYAVGGFPNDLDPSPTNPLTGTVIVQNVGTMSKAALMTTTQAGTGAQWIDTSFSVSAPFFNLSFDIDVVDVPASGLPQAGVGAPMGQAFGINVFGFGAELRLFRFAVAPSSATAGNFVYQTGPTSADVVPFGIYNEGETHHVEYHADFGTGTLTITLDGTQVVIGAPLLNPGTGAREIFIFQNGVNGITNQVAWDNLVSLPEPSSWIMLTFGAAALLGLRRRHNVAGYDRSSSAVRESDRKGGVRVAWSTCRAMA